MAENWNAMTTPRPVATATIGFVVAFTLHAIDHFRRGMAASPPAVMVGGTTRGLIVIIGLVANPPGSCVPRDCIQRGQRSGKEQAAYH
ncbi:hypothetical protein [Mycobacterium intracellulare]|uniref:hypothetical protein n=1 Tax=Mycobacterium intracellulare TaxID=1767 RepID=UPI000A5E67E3|nr:hypothetical protein [Mycobacterium intracellulare]MCA2310502.1 hypothetical protein [Mycobacterium intracellulare subsp. chimaera]MCA2352951.1 hypothetical protein [Mycobacterium intracellulare subsp. chimaera]MCV7323906.1 hypothetical protein [Mycobacterium intracellulare subsp. chimaera]MDM3904549.1 hypothetical protein [Mycobacterium intracellulare subsp. chimaera]MDM3935245.1 hypothetical protein [Mycobacterium intracellulare subsp. chimaera]